MSKKLLSIFFLSLFLILSNSCKKDKPEPNDNQPSAKTITLLTDNVEPGQIVLAQASESISLNPDTKITVNGREVTVFDAENNQLGFLMPVLPAGKVSVDYTNAGITKKLDVTIKQYTPITEPATVINNFTSEIDKAIGNLEEHTKNSTTALNPEYIELAQYLNQTIKDNLKDLSAEEQLMLAYYFRNNMVHSGDFTLDSLNGNFYHGKNDAQADAGESLVRVGKSFVKNVVIGYPTTKAGFMLAFLPSPTLLDKIAATGFLTVGLLHISDAMSDAKRIGSLTGVAEKIMEPFKKRADKIELIANADEKLYFNGEYRNLNMQDKASSNTEISAIFGALITLQDGYNKTVDIANKVMSWFPWKSPKIPSYGNPIGSQSATKNIKLPGNRLTISDVSDPAIDVTYTKAADHIVIKASSQTIKDEDKDFSFTVKFTDPALGIVLEKRVEATYKASLAVGQPYAGGIIFYLDASGKHGLVVSDKDVATGVRWATGFTEKFNGASGDFGTGLKNTENIVAASTASAAKVCYDLELNGFNDWFLPSREELALVSANLGVTNLLTFRPEYYYWSSTGSNNSAMAISLKEGYVGGLFTTNYLAVRAVRAF